MDRRIRERRAQVLRSTRRRRSILLFAPLVAVTICMSLLAALRLSFFDIKHIILSGANREVTIRLTKEISSLLGTPLIDVNTREVQAELEQSNFVRFAVVRRSWPNALTVDVSTRVPVARLVSFGGTPILVDTTGHEVELLTKVVPVVPTLCSDSIGTKSGGIKCTEQPVTIIHSSLLSARFKDELAVASAVASVASFSSMQVGMIYQLKEGGIAMSSDLGGGCILGTTKSLIEKLSLCEKFAQSGASSSSNVVDVSVPSLVTVGGWVP